MILKNIYLTDVGIFKNEQLRDLSSNLVVIGGANRSGKTTFMKVLRNLGYGFKRNNSLPQPLDEYLVETDIEDKQKGKYHLKLKGFAEPSLQSLNGEENEKTNVRELYNGLDRFTYHQVFTISLDELKKIPAGVSNKNERERLQSVLLGAGMKQIMQLPEISRYYFNKAKDIGGKRGHPTVGDFKPYKENIEQAEENKKIALKQVGNYIKTDKKIVELQNKLEELEEKIVEKENKKIRLDILKNNYDNYKKLKNIWQEMKNHEGADLSEDKYSVERKERAEAFYEDLKEKQTEYQDQLSNFHTQVSHENQAEIKEVLLAKKISLDNFNQRLSGLREKINNYLELKIQNENKLRSLEEKVAELNTNWAENMEMLEELRTDKIERLKLTEETEEYRELENHLKDRINKKDKIKKEVDELVERRKQLKKANSRKIYLISIFLGIVSLCTGFVFSLLNLYNPLLIGGGGLVLTFIYYQSNYQRAINLDEKRNELDENIYFREQEVDELTKRIEKLEKDKKSIERKMAEYRDLLGLDEKVKPAFIEKYFGWLQEAKKSYREWRNQNESLENDREEIKIELEKLVSILKKINNKFEDSPLLIPLENELVERKEELFSTFKKVMDYLQLAKELDSAERSKKEVVKEIKEEFDDFSLEEFSPEKFLQNYINDAEDFLKFRELKEKSKQLSKQLDETLNSADHIKEAFKTYKSGDKKEKDLLDIFKELYNYYPSLEEVDFTHKEVISELDKFKEEKQKLMDNLQSLRDKKERLASPEKIERAHQRIGKNRNELRKLAEEYAINRSISFILDQVQERAINRARKELLKPAAEFLAKMTEGEYQQITPPEDLQETDFTAVLSNGNKQGSVDLLSRGTREQLFLSVRLSRIQEIKPPLPVILDDSLVNFDRKHLKQTTQILSYLGKSHQIFVLTCHPHLIQQIQQNTKSVQYWYLEKGRFKRTDGDKLRELLRV
ncbi:MAG: AAA family ATPase [Halanaerobiales bacterium]